MPAIDKRIFQKMCTTTPKSISPALKALCRELSPHHDPVLVRVSPEPGAVTAECFHNVNAKVSRDGGEILYGWTLWEWPQVFIEAEHHAVWKNGHELADVTPPFSGERRLMFLPDPARVYDYANKRRVLNVRRSLGIIPAAQRWIDAAQRHQEFMESRSTGETVTYNPLEAAPLVQQRLNAQGEVLVALAARTQPDDPCICGAGRKFRKCYSPLIDLNA